MIHFTAEKLDNCALGINLAFDSHHDYCYRHFHIKLWLVKVFVMVTLGNDGLKER